MTSSGPSRNNCTQCTPYTHLYASRIHTHIHASRIHLHLHASRIHTHIPICAHVECICTQVEYIHTHMHAGRIYTHTCCSSASSTEYQVFNRYSYSCSLCPSPPPLLSSPTLSHRADLGVSDPRAVDRESRGGPNLAYVHTGSCQHEQEDLRELSRAACSLVVAVSQTVPTVFVRSAPLL